MIIPYWKQRSNSNQSIISQDKRLENQNPLRNRMKKTLWRLNQTTKAKKRRNWKTFRQLNHLPQQVHKQLNFAWIKAEITKKNSDNHKSRTKKTKGRIKGIRHWVNHYVLTLEAMEQTVIFIFKIWYSNI